MAFRHRSNVIRNPSLRRKTSWGGTAVAGTAYVAVGTSSKGLLLSITSTSLLDLVPATIVRTRGMLAFRSDQIAQTEDQIGALGIAVVSEQARAAGAASIPGPQTDSDWDGWYFWTPLYANLELGSGTAFQPRFQTNIMVDSKAMRKLNSNDAVVVMAENNSAVHALEIAVNLRTLFKLH